MTYDAATIAAYVDGELDDITARKLEREAETDSMLARTIDRQRALKSRLRAHYDPVMDEPVPDRLTALLAGTAKVDTSLSDRLAKKKVAAKARPRFHATHWGAMAACLVLGLTLGLGPLSPGGPVTTDKGALIASGALAKALDTQLASNQALDTPVRIGLTFKDKNGRYCRTFESGTLAGIGCHADGDWQLEATARGTQNRPYRQAGSGVLAREAVDMMADSPLDATDEAAAKASGWREDGRR